ncbi:unnamed protein product [Coffea canephora]|uniref:Uncharacterized protein n=1 Tax=Coffea canephora TaxID=49390 RepID=A0A068UWM2_COFCA|nr:unnamed protein product [Coffea canephora]
MIIVTIKATNCWLHKIVSGHPDGSIAIPIILKHAGVIGWGAMAMELSSFFTFVLTIVCFIGTSEDDGYSIL